MADTNDNEEMVSKFHYVLPGQVHQHRWKAGEVVELLPWQAANFLGLTLSKGYVTESGAQKAAESKAPTTKSEASKPDAKEVINVKQ